MEKRAKEHPILFSGPLVRAILDGRKTQTRRLLRWDGVQRVEPCPVGPPGNWSLTSYGGSLWVVCCPYGQPGDRLWVRETWRVGAWRDDRVALDYAAGPVEKSGWLYPSAEEIQKLNRQSLEDCRNAVARGDKRITEDNAGFRWTPGKGVTRWRPSIHMPRWASRLTLEVVEVRAQRIQEITEEDARAEGVHEHPLGRAALDANGTHKGAFLAVWEAINGARPGGSIADNPWVWAVSFKRLNGGSDV